MEVPGVEEKSQEHRRIGVNMRDTAVWCLIVLCMIFLGVQPLAAQNPLHNPPNKTQSQNRSEKKPSDSSEEIPYATDEILAWIASRVSNTAFTAHTAEFHDGHVKWQVRETYAMSVGRCSFTLSRWFDFQSGPYSQDGKNWGYISKVLKPLAR